jgi:hypothetical protein
MTVFISYSRKDEELVDRLSIELLKHDVKLWRDEYKLSGGDSLTQQIGDAICRSSFLCVALSDQAIASEWVKKEIAAGLLQAKERVGFTIVPLRIADIELPEPLQDYLYIDFTKSFEEGSRRLLNLIKRKHPDDGGFADDADYFLFWSTEGGYVGERYDLLLEVVSVDREERFCIITRIRVRGNESATKEGFQARGIDSPKAYLLQALADEFTEQPARVSLQSAKPANASFRIKSGDGELEFEALAEVKILGASEGVTVLFNVGALLSQIMSTSGAVGQGH